MRKLSDQLAELSGRVAKAEDVVTAAQDHDRQRLEAHRAELQAAVQTGQRHVAAAEDSAASWWAQTRTSAEEWFAGRRAEVVRRHDEHDLEKAQHRADNAENVAAESVDFALFALDQAELAIVDAALARADADTFTSH
jgi:RNA polymerase-binding transcription factor DksA